jgi:hypothetical protein
MMKRVLIILGWTAGAYFGGGIVLAVIWGLLIGIASFVSFELHYDLHSYLAAHLPSVELFRIIFRAMCALIAVAAFILASRGRLPGTRPQS